MTGYLLLIPEALLVFATLRALFSDRLPGRDRGAAVCGAIVTIIGVTLVALQPSGEALFGDRLVFDQAAQFIRIGILVAAALWFVWLVGRRGGRNREAAAVASLVTLGALLMATAVEMVTLVVALELATLPAYILVGYRRDSRRSLEGALKYFLISMTTSLVMLYGLSLLYGMNGSTFLFDLGVGEGALGMIATLFVFAGLFAKLSAAPFHFWAPDAYEGADTWAVGFVATVPKMAGFLVAMRFVLAIGVGSPVVPLMIAIVAVASMVLGNLAALGQRDVRRIMAYSGVAQIGYALIALVATSEAVLSASLYFIVAYSIATLGILLAFDEKDARLSVMAGFSKRSVVAAVSAAVLLFSLIGLPPLAGFIGKLLLFTSALDLGQLLLVLVAVVTSIVSAAYYLRIVKAMFVDAPTDLADAVRTEESYGSVTAPFVTVAAALIIVLAGVFGSALIEFFGLAVR